ncbi:MAG: helix-turn-helix domain-containing protein [Frankiaceae bacterium]|nr:helix-turn-helix domain-containing protein [Frankiaceae bacterium]
MDVGGLLRTARYGAGLSQRALAARAGVAASSLSRFESGAARPSLEMAERLLATCGKDAVWTLVERHADLDAELDRRAALAPLKRLQSVGLVTWLFVQDLARLDVLLGGAWAASLHGIPHEDDHGVLWCSGDEQAVGAFAALLQRHIALFYYEGQLSSPNIRPAHLRGPQPEWLLRNVGRFATRLVLPGEPWPREVRIAAAAEHEVQDAQVLLRVVPAEDLGPGDGVRPEVLDRFLARRAAGGHRR